MRINFIALVAGLVVFRDVAPESMAPAALVSIGFAMVYLYKVHYRAILAAE